MPPLQRLQGIISHLQPQPTSGHPTSKAIDTLKGKVAVVTGSSSGVGASTVKLLASKGCDVVVCYNSSKGGAEKVAAECRNYGVRALVCQGDVSKEANCKQLVDEVMNGLGRIDLLVNNAGATKRVPLNNLTDLSQEDFQWIYATNTISAYNMIRYCTPHMKAVGGGRVVMLASHAGTHHTVGSSMAYICSKAALVAMTRAMAKALGPDIKINAVCPGFIEGEYLVNAYGKEAYDNLKNAVISKVPGGAVNTGEDVAQAVLWFLEGAPNITGEAITMDAGFGLMRGPAF